MAARKWRRIRRVLLVLMALPLLVLAALYLRGAQQLGRDYAQVRATLPTDLVGDPARGDYLARTRGCRECHGEDLGGRIMVDDRWLLRLVAPNLTRGAGGAATPRDAARFDLALRHGIGSDRRALVGMPSRAFARISDEEVAHLRAFLRVAPPVQRELPATRVGPLGHVLLAVGAFSLPAESIAHERAPPARAPELRASVEYGEYLAQGCKGCHGADFRGGLRHGPPDFPPSANLTPHRDGLASWNQADFERALRDGIRPDGSAIDARAMPVAATRALEPVELEALWAYLSQVAAVPSG
jgi:mono/diheme cytochrome c family protein/cytochrome c553